MKESASRHYPDKILYSKGRNARVVLTESSDYKFLFGTKFIWSPCANVLTIGVCENERERVDLARK